MNDSTNPLIVQSDLTVLLEVASPRAGEARARVARFAELEKAPEHIHTYRITPLSLWNAAVAGVSSDDVVDTLTGLAKYPVPAVVIHEVTDQINRYGRVWLARAVEGLVLVADDDVLLDELAGVRSVAELLGRRLDRHRFAVGEHDRGALKQALLAAGWPAADEAGFESGAPLGPMVVTADLRPYQRDAVETWWRSGDASGGSGVVVLPCGAGKTVVGLAAMAAAGSHALVVCTSVSAIRQWMRETLDKTTLSADDLGEWSGQRKQLRPVTFVTYQSLTWTDPAAAPDVDIFDRHPHLSLFSELGWGLVVYDEVHLLPAPVFRAAARVQAVRRLGLTATLVREDGREGDIFSLIGPKRYDAPWAEIEAAGWIAPAMCTEVRVTMSPDRRAEYATTDPKLRHRVAATTPEKLAVVESLVERHRGEQILVIGQFVEQLRDIADRARRAAAHRPDRPGDPRPVVRRDAHREPPGAGRVEDRQLRHRPARGQRRHPGVGPVRQPPGRSPTTRTDPAPEDQRGHGQLLHGRHRRHRRDPLRPEPSALPRRAGLRLRHRRRPRGDRPRAADCVVCAPPGVSALRRRWVAGRRRRCIMGFVDPSPEPRPIRPVAAIDVAGGGRGARGRRPRHDVVVRPGDRTGRDGRLTVDRR